MLDIRAKRLQAIIPKSLKRKTKLNLRPAKFSLDFHCALRYDGHGYQGWPIMKLELRNCRIEWNDGERTLYVVTIDEPMATILTIEFTPETIVVESFA